MFAGITSCPGVQFPALITVKNKRFIKFGHISQTDIRRLRKFLQRHENFMAYIKGRLMIQTEAFDRKVNGVSVKGICNHFFPDRIRKVGAAIIVFVVGTNVCPQFLQRKRCFLHLKPYRMTDCAVQCGQAGLGVSSLSCSIMVTASSNEEFSSSENLLIWQISNS